MWSIPPVSISDLSHGQARPCDQLCTCLLDDDNCNGRKFALGDKIGKEIRKLSILGRCNYI